MFRIFMPKGINTAKLSKLVRALYENSDGLWVRELSRRSGLASSTVHHYLNLLSPLLEETGLGERPLIRVVKFRPEVMKRLDRGMTISELVKMLDILRKV